MGRRAACRSGARTEPWTEGSHACDTWHLADSSRVCLMQGSRRTVCMRPCMPRMSTSLGQFIGGCCPYGLQVTTGRWGWKDTGTRSGTQADHRHTSNDSCTSNRCVPEQEHARTHARSTKHCTSAVVNCSGTEQMKRRLMVVEGRLAAPVVEQVVSGWPLGMAMGRIT